MDTKGGKRQGVVVVMNWAIWIDMYTLTCIRLMTNKNLLYKRKIKKNKIQGYIVQHREYSQCFMLKKK